MGKVRPNALIVFLLAAACCLSCAEMRPPDTRITELQSQLIELQRSQASLNARMDELSNSILVLQESYRHSKLEIQRLTSGSAPQAIVDKTPPMPAPPVRVNTTPPEKPQAAKASIVTPKKTTKTGQGGEFVAPPPEIDPVVQEKPKTTKRAPRPATTRSSFETAPGKALLDDPAFQKAWEIQQSGRYALAVYEWNDVAGSATEPAIVTASHFYQGEAYLQLKDFQQAISLFKSLENKPGVYGKIAAFKLGLCYENSGQLDIAVKQYQSVLEKYPDTPVATMAQAQLDAMK